MVVGACRLVLHLPQARTLKDKRSVVKSALDQLHGRFRLAVAEVGSLDAVQVAELGLAAVGSQERTVRQVMDAAARFIEERFPVELGSCETFFA